MKKVTITYSNGAKEVWPFMDSAYAGIDGWLHMRKNGKIEGIRLSTTIRFTIEDQS